MPRMFVLYLAGLALRSTGVAAVAGVCTWRMQSVVRRHAIWLAVLGIMLLMPAADWVLLLVRLPGPPAIILGSFPTPRSVPPASMAEVSTSAVTAVETVPALPSGGRDWWTILAGLYGISASLLAVQMTLAHARLRKLKRASRPVFTRLFAQNDHGLHIRRCDWPVAMLAAFNTVVFWYNPLSWWLERRLAALCEEASDEASISALGNPARYSEVLLQFARATVGGRLQIGGVAMARRNIASRIERILAIKRPGCGVLTRTSAAIVFVLAMPVLYLASVIHATPEESTTITVPGPAVPVPLAAPIRPLVPVAIAKAPSQTVGTLSGTIFGLGGSFVVALLGRANQVIGSAVTDSGSEFALTGVPADSYWLRVQSAPGSPVGPFMAVVRLDLTQPVKKRLTPEHGPVMVLDFETNAQVQRVSVRQVSVQPSAARDFEVATIKPTKLLEGVREACHGIDSKFAADSLDSGVPLGRCVISAGRLSHMIGLAYGVSMDMLKGGPDWVATGADRFDLEAKAEDPANTTQSQLLEMLQRLLADRFQLKFHRETREVQGFALLVSRNGLKMRKSESSERKVSMTAGGSDEPAAIKGTPEGVLRTVVGQRFSMKDLVSFLRPFAQGQLLDETQLDGVYDLKLTWESGESLAGPLEQQLGLHLEPRKIPVDFFIIDSAEKPVP